MFLLVVTGGGGVVVAVTEIEVFKCNFSSNHSSHSSRKGNLIPNVAVVVIVEYN